MEYGAAPSNACYGDDDETRDWCLLMRRTPQVKRYGPAPRSVVQKWCEGTRYSNLSNGIAGVGLNSFCWGR